MNAYNNTLILMRFAYVNAAASLLCRLLIQRLELMKDELRQRIAKEVNFVLAVEVLYMLIT